MVLWEQTSCSQNRNLILSKGSEGFSSLRQSLSNVLLWESWKQELYLGGSLTAQLKVSTSWFWPLVNASF